jgi:hypothetical protein
MSRSTTLFLAAALIAGSFVAGAALLRVGPAAAQQGSSSNVGGTVNSNNRFIAATGSVGSGMSVLWVVDTETKRVLVYGTNSMGKNIELRAARNIEWDTKLDYLNDDSQWKVEDLQALAEKRRQAAAAAAGAKDREKEPAPSTQPKEGKEGGK